MIKENSKIVFKYVQSQKGADLTGNDIAEATNLSPKSIVGIVNAFVKKGLMYREEATVELEDGSTKTVKFIRLTDEGATTDIDTYGAEADAE